MRSPAGGLLGGDAAMPEFETFRRQAGSSTREPAVTLLKRGALSLNDAAFALLGTPDTVELLYDRAKHVVGLRAVAPRAPHAYWVRPAPNSDHGPYVVSAMAFTRHYGIDVTVSRRWTAYLDDDALCIDLTTPGTPVTSNRARPGQL